MRAEKDPRGGIKPETARLTPQEAMRVGFNPKRVHPALKEELLRHREAWLLAEHQRELRRRFGPSYKPGKLRQGGWFDRFSEQRDREINREGGLDNYQVH